MSGTILWMTNSVRLRRIICSLKTIDSQRTIRQAERFLFDSNMILNLPDFVSFIFTTTTLPSASLISPIKVRSAG